MDELVPRHRRHLLGYMDPEETLTPDQAMDLLRLIFTAGDDLTDEELERLEDEDETAEEDEEMWGEG